MAVAGADGLEHALGPGAVDGGAQADVGRVVDDVQPLGGEQHEGGGRAGQVREHAGMAVVVVAGGVQRLLVDRRGDDAGDLAGHRVLHRRSDEAEGGVAGAGVELARRDGAAGDRLVVHRGGGEGQRGAEETLGLLEARAVAVDADLRTVLLRHPAQGLDDDLGADPGGIAHGDADQAHAASGGANPVATRVYRPVFGPIRRDSCGASPGPSPGAHGGRREGERLPERL